MTTMLYGFRNGKATRQTQPPPTSTRPASCLPLTADELDAWEERVATCVVDGNLSQAEAERIAWQQVDQQRRAQPPTVLKHCRCQDCRRLRDRCCTVGVLVPGAYPLNDWHFCAEYLGPAISPHTVVWHYDDVPVAQQAAHVGPGVARATPVGQGADRGGQL